MFAWGLAMPNTIYSKNKNAGMTFIEVLIALVIIVTGILGAVGMQAMAKQASFDAMQRSLASSLAEDILSRMRANSPAALANYADNGVVYGQGNYLEPNQRCNNSGVDCTVNEIRINDQFEWDLALMGGNVLSANNDRVGGLINATGCITVVGSNVTVVVSWEGRAETIDATKDANCGPAAQGKRRQVLVQAFII
ncbi:type IV pilus modification protein PilV [Litorilituus sediminis]|uniref:Type IV pilus modification protein PilV n=2 Tax=Litorilituus sediminis TaxID=718192 RepID=A0A4P6P7D6_9GAMM|nr:type IV pilus modification protein PilV [Litorilituus sediminis]